MLQPTNIEFNNWLKNFKIVKQEDGSIGLPGAKTKIIGDYTKRYLEQCKDGIMPDLKLIATTSQVEAVKNDVVLIPQQPKHMGKATDKPITCLLDVPKEAIVEPRIRGSGIAQRIEEARTTEIEDEVPLIDSKAITHNNQHSRISEAERFEEIKKNNATHNPTSLNLHPDLIKDIKQRIITFEMISLSKFTIKQNFYMTDTVVSLAKKYNGKYDPDKRVDFTYEKYKEAANEIIKLQF